jgi:hypothetical protein
VKTILSTLLLTILSTLLFAGLLTLTAAAQSPYPQEQLVVTSGTNNIVAAYSNDWSATVIEVPRGRNLTIELGFRLCEAGTATVGVEFQRSMLGSTNWLFWKSLSVAATGTTPAVTMTNWDTEGYTRIRARYATNLNTVALTNPVLRAVYKPGL